MMIQSDTLLVNARVQAAEGVTWCTVLFFLSSPEAFLRAPEGCFSCRCRSVQKIKIRNSFSPYDLLEATDVQTDIIPLPQPNTPYYDG